MGFYADGSIVGMLPKKGMVAKVARWLWRRFPKELLQRLGFEMPPANSFIGVGGEDGKHILLKWDAGSGKIEIPD